MKKLLIQIVIVAAVGGCFTQFAAAQVDNEENQVELKTAKAFVITCKGMIDDGLYKSIKRRTEIALEAGADYLIYEIETYGGLLKSADDISKYFILDVAKKVHTVAYITTEAISAGAMISVSCKDIVMLENTTIGDCAPITLGGKLEGVEREKVESFTRAAFGRAAQANNYPAALLKAMVSMQIEVYRLKNLTTGEYEFFETDKLPKRSKKYNPDIKELIVKNDELLTLTAFDALEYGIARAKVKNLSEVLDFFAKRDGVKFAEKPVILRTNWSEEMVRWVNSPAVMGVLVMLALLGVYIEFNTPGVGLPGLTAVICFAIIVGSKYLVGMANWLEVAVFAAGVLLLMIEIFVLPGFGAAGFLGMIFISAGLFGMLIKNAPNEIPWPQTDFDWQLFINGVFGIAMGFVGFVLLAWMLTRYLPKMKFLNGLILVPKEAKSCKIRQVKSSSIAGKNVSVKVGDIGEVTSILRPAGKAKFADAIVDVIAHAEFLGKCTKIEVIEIHGNRVIVKEIINKN